MLRKWEDLPAFMQCDEVRPYWEGLRKKRFQLAVKRGLDFLLALVLPSQFWWFALAALLIAGGLWILRCC